jgi:hypothetical protein
MNLELKILLFYYLEILYSRANLALLGYFILFRLIQQFNFTNPNLIEYFFFCKNKIRSNYNNRSPIHSTKTISINQMIARAKRFGKDFRQQNPSKNSFF